MLKYTLSNLSIFSREFISCHLASVYGVNNDSKSQYGLNVRYHGFPAEPRHMPNVSLTSTKAVFGTLVTYALGLIRSEENQRVWKWAFLGGERRRKGPY